MKKFYFFLIVLGFSNNILAQNSAAVISVIGAQGGNDRTEFITLEWTLGESSVETLNSAEGIYTQGFHQSFFNQNEPLKASLEFNKFIPYPNPVISNLTLYLNSKPTASTHIKFFSISLYSIQGRFIKQSIEQLQNSKIVIDIKNLSPGVYILHIDRQNGAKIENHQIIKN